MIDIVVQDFDFIYIILSSSLDKPASTESNASSGRCPEVFIKQNNNNNVR